MELGYIFLVIKLNTVAIPSEVMFKTRIGRIEDEKWMNTQFYHMVDLFLQTSIYSL